MIKKLLDVIFPTSCCICGKLYSDWICPKCYLNLKNELKFRIIDEKEFRIFFIGFYENKLRNFLLKFKFKDSAYMCNFFTSITIKNKEFINKIKNYDYIIPVPMFEKNKLIRGYNQTELLARKIAEKIDIEYLSNVLIKTKENHKQSQLNEKQRIENVKNVYDIRDSQILKNKKILLLDDIYTTGSTVKECIKTLKKVKNCKVDVFIIAKRN